MYGSLYYEVTSNGRRVALCVDRTDAEQVARYWEQGRVGECHALIIDNPHPIEPNTTYTYTFGPAPVGEAKRIEE